MEQFLPLSSSRSNGIKQMIKYAQGIREGEGGWVSKNNFLGENDASKYELNIQMVHSL